MSQTEQGIMVSPRSLRIAACGICQLKCPLCATRIDPSTGKDEKLRIGDFKGLIDRNPLIRKVELGGYGEVFLNENLPEMLRYAYEKKVITSIGAGTNLNHVSDEALESLVLYQVARVRCSIDGVTQETYQEFRVGGDLNRVIRNIERINALKERYRSSRPHLIFQFIVFGHNQHEIERAAFLARMLKMEFFPRLSRVAVPEQYRERIRSLIGYSCREDYLERVGRQYRRDACYHLWKSPQIRWDGELLGCACNEFGTYPGNVFEEDLMPCINSEKMMYARDMLMGRKPPREDVPCVRCDCYESMFQLGNWITESELRAHRNRCDNRAGG